VLGGQALGVTVLQSHFRDRRVSYEFIAAAKSTAAIGVAAHSCFRVKNIASTLLAAAFIGLIANFSVRHFGSNAVVFALLLCAFAAYAFAMMNRSVLKDRYCDTSN
jgi:hypothetical protein